MVKLTQIEDEQETTFQEQQSKTSTDAPVVQDEDDFETEDEDDSDFEDDFNEDETIVERIIALKDIIPPAQRSQVSSLASYAYNTVSSSITKAGSLTWIFTTSALLLGVPLSLSILAEQQLLELEKEFKLQQGANDILASGEQPQPATATTA
ncbi:hypothetical protein WICMUC_002193 [Wickerhamomyces mucosus]|uniref:Mitochondrial import receptor subunit TOM22 n=1 Tax=Wickerhamomyces mucosus TaxID=1378264 RepID=A0A9P8TER8_9ASCO|nr:hypothetical protein WICMUC_002193 [Wickerhamomyces mucosus]